MSFSHFEYGVFVAQDLRILRVEFPIVKLVAVDAVFCNYPHDWLGRADEFDCLGFELCGVTLAWFGIHQE